MSCRVHLCFLTAAALASEKSMATAEYIRNLLVLAQHADRAATVRSARVRPAPGGVRWPVPWTVEDAERMRIATDAHIARPTVELVGTEKPVGQGPQHKAVSTVLVLGGGGGIVTAQRVDMTPVGVHAPTLARTLPCVQVVPRPLRPLASSASLRTTSMLNVAAPTVDEAAEVVSQQCAAASEARAAPASADVRARSSADDVLDVHTRCERAVDGDACPTSRAQLRPRRRRLCSKRSLRCRSCVERGQPGILLMPELYALKGDRSNAGRSPVGKWFQKESMARSLLPTVEVSAGCRAEGPAVVNELLIQLTNPLAEEVHITLNMAGDGVVVCAQGRSVVVCCRCLPACHVNELNHACMRVPQCDLPADAVVTVAPYDEFSAMDEGSSVPSSRRDGSCAQRVRGFTSPFLTLVVCALRPQMIRTLSRGAKPIQRHSG